MIVSEKLVLEQDTQEHSLTSTLEKLWKNESFVDVTLACEDDLVVAHQVILSASSPYFEKLLRRNPQKHPFIHLRGILKKDLLRILEFIYSAKTEVLQEDLSRFMDLQVITVSG